MNAITIDPALYHDVEQYAKEQQISLKEFFEYAVSKVLPLKPVFASSPSYMDTEEYKNAYLLMDSFVADDLKTPVAADEDVTAALTKEKYL